VRQSAIMTDEETKRVVFNFGKKKLTLQARGAEAGRSKVEMPLEYEGKAIEISFNPAFLVDMLRIIPADAALTLELVDGNNVALFRVGDEYSYLVMPLS
jgi:DNA polymerase-3 subunit beta